LVVDIIDNVSVLGLNLFFVILVLIVIFLLFFVPFTSLIVVVFGWQSLRCAVVEFDDLTRSIDFDTSWERTSTWWGCLTTVSCRFLIRSIYKQLFVVLLIQGIELHFDVDLFPPAHSASAGVSMLLLHLLDHSILFDLNQIASFRIIETAPEVGDVLSVFGGRLCPDLSWGRVGGSLSFGVGTLCCWGMVMGGWMRVAISGRRCFALDRACWNN
jgi:hypothetical protein